MEKMKLLSTLTMTLLIVGSLEKAHATSFDQRQRGVTGNDQPARIIRGQRVRLSRLLLLRTVSMTIDCNLIIHVPNTYSASMPYFIDLNFDSISMFQTRAKAKAKAKVKERAKV
jgi:hypothetical protein